MLVKCRQDFRTVCSDRTVQHPEELQRPCQITQVACTTATIDVILASSCLINVSQDLDWPLLDINGTRCGLDKWPWWLSGTEGQR